MPNCPNCGRDIQGGIKVCPNCGQDSYSAKCLKKTTWGAMIMPKQANLGSQHQTQQAKAEEGKF